MINFLLVQNILLKSKLRCYRDIENNSNKKHNSVRQHYLVIVRHSFDSGVYFSLAKWCSMFQIDALTYLNQA